MEDDAIAALVCRTARDIVESNALQEIPDALRILSAYAAELPELYQTPSASMIRLQTEVAPVVLFDRLVSTGVADLDTYFYSLVELHKRRLRYESILSAQPFPRLEQVGPRAILQYGQADPATIAVLLTWRKWIYDIDNRAAQETGYLFEPALAGALGGVKVHANGSPIRRLSDTRKGRQVDCLIENPSGRWAYEFKIRVTIAASGQGRWAEELGFPEDARAAGFVPVLVVFDGTPNEKLSQLCAAFGAMGGEAYTGNAAWQHIEARSGAVMAVFVEKYLRGPMAALIEYEPNLDELPAIEFSMAEREVMISIGGSNPIVIARNPANIEAAEELEDKLL